VPLIVCPVFDFTIFVSPLLEFVSPRLLNLNTGVVEFAFAMEVEVAMGGG
jgi:hypothetical protein